jgi:photosystem II stability/assembly factor-like uncharacterized protein
MRMGGSLMSVGRKVIVSAVLALSLAVPAWAAAAVQPAAASGSAAAAARAAGAAPAPKAEGPVPWTWLAHGTIDFASASSGWFCGYNPESGCWTIYRSTDGGSTWSRQRRLFDISYSEYGPSEMILHALSDRCCFAVDGRRVFRTTDGGRHWRRMYVTGSKSTSIDQASFVSPSVGYCSISTMSRWYVKRTTDGGRSWATVASSPDYYWALDFVDSQHGWVARGDRALRTTDGGRTWQRCGRTKIEGVFRVSFVSRSVGWAAGLWGVEKTTDGGRTWHLQLKQWWNGGSGLLAQSPSVVWSCGIGGERSSGVPGIGARAAQESGMPYLGTFRRSTDGGASWKELAVTEAYWFDAVGARCWALCRPENGDSYILRSEDRGDSWTRL